MPREITQRELRNDSGRIMRALDAGESFVITRNGVPVGTLVPSDRRFLVPKEIYLGRVAQEGRIDFRRFREEVDAVVDQDPAPRA